MVSVWDNREHLAGCVQKAVQQGRSEEECEAYVGTVELLSDGERPADFSASC